MNFHNLSSGSSKNKTRINPVLRRVMQCVVIILPSLLFSSAVLAVEEAPKTIRLTKAGKRLIKSERAVEKYKKSMDVFRKSSGVLVSATICKKGTDKVIENTIGPISKTSALTGFILAFLCGGLVFMHALED
jgi:hypothetical protein